MTLQHRTFSTALYSSVMMINFTTSHNATCQLKIKIYIISNCYSRLKIIFLGTRKI